MPQQLLDADGWIDAAEQSDDVIHGIRAAVTACAINLGRIADALESADEEDDTDAATQ